MLSFAVDVITLCQTASRNSANTIITSQLIRSASAIGSNYSEANNAASKSDFRNKIFIAKKEAAETRYWLKLFRKIDSEIEISDLLDEVGQLLMILQKIVSTMKNGK